MTTNKKKRKGITLACDGANKYNIFENGTHDLDDPIALFERNN